MGGNERAEGRVEICINSAWGAVCEAGFTKEEATVVCRQLGELQNEGVYNVPYQRRLEEVHVRICIKYVYVCTSLKYSNCHRDIESLFSQNKALQETFEVLRY